MKADRRQFIGLFAGFLAAFGRNGKPEPENAADRFSRGTTRTLGANTGSYSMSRIISCCPVGCIGTGGIHATSNGGYTDCLPRHHRRAAIYFVPADSATL